MTTQVTADELQKNTLLLEPEVVLLPDGMAQGQSVLVRDGVFAEIGPVESMRRTHPEVQPLPLADTLLMPGFIDTHHHLTQAFGKSLVFGEPSEIFRRVWMPMESSLDAETAYLSAKLAALESLRGGFTTVCDAGTRMAADLPAVADAAQDAGLRCVLGKICNDLNPSGVVAPFDEIHKAAAGHLQRWGHYDLIHPSLAISIPEAATRETLKAMVDLCQDNGVVFQTHVNEHLAGVERSLERTGRRPIEGLFDIGALGPATLLAHATLLTPIEVRMLRETDAAVCYNPVASAWKGNAVAPATTFAAEGIRFGLGTDGTRGDGFRLMDAAETAQRLTDGLRNGDSSSGAGWTWLDHATRGAADVVGLANVTGRIAEGLAADFLLVDLDVPEMTPSWDLSWELVRLAARDQIFAVLVAGELRLWQGRPVDWDERLLLEETRQRARRIVNNSKIHVIHPTSGNCRPNGQTKRAGVTDE